MEISKQRSNYHTDTLQKIHSAPESEFSLKDKAYAEEKNQEAYNKSVKAMYSLLYGGVEKKENNNKNTDDVKLNANVNSVKTIKETMSEYEDYIKGIESEVERNTGDNSIE